MEIDLRKVSMNIGQQYETIITTIDNEGKTNAAPFGVRVFDKDKVQLKIFEGGNTIKNIREKEEFIVNITADPIMFTFASTDTIPDEYLSIISYGDSKLAHIKDVDAYFICKDESIKNAQTKNDPIKSSEINIIKADVLDLKINNPCVKPINRGIHAIIESLVNYSRINIVDEEKQAFFIERFKESERMVKKVGSKDERKAIEILKDSLIKEGFDV